MEINVRPTWRSLSILSVGIAAIFTIWFLLAGFEWLRAGSFALLIASVAMLTLSQLQVRISAIGDVIRINYPLASCKASTDEVSSALSDKFAFRSDHPLGIAKLLFGTRIFGFYVGYFELNDGSTAYACLSRKKHARAVKINDSFHLLLDPGVAKRLARYCDDVKTHGYSLESRLIT